MNLWLRILYVYLRSLFLPKLEHWTTTSKLPLRVWLTDLDTNLHMNNGRFLTVMDLGRFDLLLRSGLWDMVRHTGAVPILAAAQIRYRRPLNFWTRFYLESAVTAWDQKWFYIEQRFIYRDGPDAGKVAAIGLVKGSFFDTQTKTTIPTEKVMAHLGEEVTFPPLPEAVTSWGVAEDELRKLTAV
jgi:acyl-CoA thioesterase FadM